MDTIETIKKLKVEYEIRDYFDSHFNSINAELRLTSSKFDFEIRPFERRLKRLEDDFKDYKNSSLSLLNNILEKCGK